MVRVTVVEASIVSGGCGRLSSSTTEISVSIVILRAWLIYDYEAHVKVARAVQANVMSATQKLHP